MKKQTQTLLSIAVLLSLLTLFGATAFAQAETKSAEDSLAWWRDARFGLFIHWGPVSLKGTEIGWSRGGERRGTGGGKGPIPVEVYDNLYKEFNPVNFNAKEWVQIAKNAGMKYLVFTSRHHDGFSMFDSALTDYKITNSPFKRDVVAELAEACHEAGLGLGFYYSPPDWHHPDYRTENHARFIEYLHGQIRELCTKYGKVDILWFDGLGGTAKDWDAENLIKMIRSLQPGIIVNNRAGLPEDFETPEQTIGQFQNTRPWETCMTIGDQWAWKPNDNVKSFKDCISVLIKCAGGDGNLLFNVGPMPDGRIEDRQVARLSEMGAWLKQYGESIYGTRGGPFLPGPWGVSTCRGNSVYVHILDWDAAGPALSLPPLPAKITAAATLAGGEAAFTQNEEGITITVPENVRQQPDTIVVLTLNTPASAIKPVGAPSRSVLKGAKAKASNIHQNDPTYAPEKAVDDDESSRWATDGGTHQAWLEVSLDKPATVSEMRVKEACGDRVQRFVLQYRDGAEWKTALSGKTLGEKFHAEFAPVTASTFRLDIQEATEGPTLWEFQLLAPKKDKTPSKP